MDKAKLMERLMATFLEELDEHVRSLNEGLLALEKKTDAADAADALQTLFRTAHSLKGAARAVNVTLLESVCHRLEDVLSAIRDGSTALGPSLFALLFQTADGIEEASMRLREQKDLAGSPLIALLPHLAGVVEEGKETVLQKFSGRAHVTGETVEAPDDPPRAASPPSSPPTVAPQTAPPRVAPPTVAPPTVAPLRTGVAAETPSSGGSVRVPAEKLDTLLAQIGELLVARRRVEGRLTELQAARDLVEQWKTSWRPLERLLGKHHADEEGSGEARVTTAGPNGGAAVLPRREAAILRDAGENLRRLNKSLDDLGVGLTRDVRFLKQVAVPLDGEVRRVRMLPFAEACQGLDRTVRDVAQHSGKMVEVMIEGGDVELDRSVLEGLKDPLRHLVRNAVDHGIETPDRRRAADKSPCGLISITAALRGTQVEVTVADDGRGLDYDALREQARRRGLPDSLDERELADLVFQPGLSTAPIITDVSGRGVGLDVVKTQVESLHGSVSLGAAAGRGTKFTLTVPLTLTTLRVVLVVVSGQTLAIAGSSIQKLTRVAPGDIRTIGGRQALLLGGAPMPVTHLSGVLGFPTAKVKPDERLLVCIIAAGDRRMGFVVDELLAEQEIVVKSLGTRIRRARLVSGATMLPSGRIALVLNAAGVLRAAQRQASGMAVAGPAKQGPPVKKRLLVVDDSVTTRTLEKSILEAAGYQVTTAGDGQAAWEFLQEHGADLMVSDVEMPRMDGFTLTATARASKRFERLPIVLVTALENERDKARGIEVGADAYLVKRAFDQNSLLEAVAQLL